MKTQEESTITSIRRATGLLVIAVENSNPNGDPDYESDPRQRSHDKRGMITGVSFKRKPRDLVLRKDEPVWTSVAKKFGIMNNSGVWGKDGLEFDILEKRDIKRKEIEDIVKEDFDKFKKMFWDARVFGNTFLEKGLKGTDPVRAGVAQFGLAVSVSPIRIHRLTKTKVAPAQGGKEDKESGDSETSGPTRGMAPQAHRVVEHGVYCMPFFINPTGAQGKRSTGCTPLDIAILLQLIRYAYPHTKSDIRSLVEIRHAWYAEHEDGLGSFSEFEFIEKLTPKRKGGDKEKPSVSGIPLDEQYEMPEELPSDFRGKPQDKLLDLCVDLPEWCNKLMNEK